jgi:phosphoglucosamine mutase
VTTAVGDRYVIEKLRTGELSLGGEQSGHIIHRDFSTTGDGIITALQVLRMIQETGKTVTELGAVVDIYPQKLVNLDVPSKPAIDTLAKLQSAMEACDQALGDDGRQLVRYSGTENMIRVMVEAATADLVDEWSDRLIAAVSHDFGIS